MKLTKPTTGEKVSVKQFLSEWKKGMQEVTPLQQTIAAQWGQIISAIGVIWGIVFSIMIHYWWMAVILIGGLVVLATQMLGNWQKKMILKKIEELQNAALPMEELPA